MNQYERMSDATSHHQAITKPGWFQVQGSRNVDQRLELVDTKHRLLATRSHQLASAAIFNIFLTEKEGSGPNDCKFF